MLKADVRLAPTDRRVIKRKIPEFDERRFDESAPWNANAHLSLRDLQVLASRAVNEARIASARSKVGDGRAEALRDEVELDILVDLEATFPRALKALSSVDEAALRHQLRVDISWACGPRTPVRTSATERR